MAMIIMLQHDAIVVVVSPFWAGLEARIPQSIADRSLCDNFSVAHICIPAVQRVSRVIVTGTWRHCLYSQDT
ncbi:hypothetical protein F4824DRAFT_457247 [Ustulina deusta]|nr:hypothetical protein F4824DRAFT_457247 [Ustulina deusta]